MEKRDNDAHNDASNVWDCIRHYNNDQYCQIEKLYPSASAIIKKLESYPEKSAYHGHIKGQQGDGEHKGAAAARATAIKYLKDNKPVQLPELVRIRPDLGNKKENEKWDEKYQKVITTWEEEVATKKNPNTTLCTRLNQVNPLNPTGWKKGGAWDEYLRLCKHNGKTPTEKRK